MQGLRLRFLLDQGFPRPRLPVKELQENVDYVHFSHAFPELAAASTPDWMLYLVAKSDGFDGVVTKDIHQVLQPEELVALTRLGLSVITWRDGVDDPVTAWALVVAYMPEIMKRLPSRPGSIFLLPSPRLHAGSGIVEPLDRAREIFARDKISLNEAESQSLDVMRAELTHRKRMDLFPLLAERTRKKRSPPSKSARPPPPVPEQGRL